MQAAIDDPALIRGVQIMNISLRMLHVSKQAPWQRPLVKALQVGRVGVAGGGVRVSEDERVGGGWLGGQVGERMYVCEWEVQALLETLLASPLGTRRPSLRPTHSAPHCPLSTAGHAAHQRPGSLVLWPDRQHQGCATNSSFGWRMRCAAWLLRPARVALLQWPTPQPFASCSQVC